MAFSLFGIVERLCNVHRKLEVVGAKKRQGSHWPPAAAKRTIRKYTADITSRTNDQSGIKRRGFKGDLAPSKISRISDDSMHMKDTDANYREREATGDFAYNNAQPVTLPGSVDQGTISMQTDTTQLINNDNSTNNFS